MFKKILLGLCFCFVSTFSFAQGILMTNWAGWGNPPVNIIKNSPIVNNRSAVDILAVDFLVPSINSAGQLTLDTSKSGNFDKPGSIAYQTLQAYRQKYPNTKIIVDIGGWGARNFWIQTSLKNKINEVAKQIAAFVKKNKFDGVAVDPEYMFVSNGATRIQGDTNVARLVIELRKLLPGKLITFDAITSNTSYPTLFTTNQYANTFKASLNYLDLMAYNAGRNVAVGNGYQKFMKIWMNIVPKDKILLGMQPKEPVKKNGKWVPIIVSPSIFKKKAAWESSNYYGGVFMYALSPEQKVNKKGYSFLNYLQAMYAGLKNKA